MARTPDQPTSTAKSRRRHAELLDAARTTFEERGYVETSVSDIVRTAGGSRASFYSYFTSKDDALSVLVEELTEDLVAATARDVESGLTAFERLGATIGQFMEAYRDRARLLLVLDQATTISDEFLAIRLAIRAQFAGALEATLIERWQYRPDPDGLDPGLVALSLGGMVEDLARGRYLFGQDFDDDQAVRTLAVLWARALGISTKSRM